MAKYPIAAALVLCLTFGGVRATELEIHTHASGHISGVSVDGAAAVRGVQLHVAQPEWKGAVASTAQARPMEQRTEPDGGKMVKVVAPGSGQPAIEVVRRTRGNAKSVEVEFTVTPYRDLATQATLVQFALPTADYRGRQWLLVGPSPSQQDTFPEQLPDPYTFLSASDFQLFAIQAPGRDAYLAIEPDWDTVRHMQVQDNRKFGGSEFEIQLYADVPLTLRKGSPYRMSFKLKRLSRQELAAAREAADLPRREMASRMTGRGPARIIEMRPNQQRIATYDKFELAVELDAEFTNPFDPDDVALDATFVTPSGKEHVVPGFFWQDYTRSLQRRRERLSPSEDYGWRVRYCPTETGVYRYWLNLRDGDREVRSDPTSFEAIASPQAGFVRVARQDPYMLETDNGAPYFAIGENVCWPGPGGTFDYDNYWSKLAAHGANYARLWIGPFDAFTLERLPRSEGEPVGLGSYDLAAAWRIDYVVDLAQQHGLRLMYCIESFNSLRGHEPHARWDENPYNAARGGPIELPEQFFTDEAARRLFRQRLRYAVARWSYSPAILSWEFWNEVNIIQKYVSADVVAWHCEMGRYLRQLDPHDHLITTSWAGIDGDPALDSLPEMEYVQSHQYGARDASQMIAVSRDKLARYQKPHYFGEYGTGVNAEGTREDKTGIHLHNGLWSGLIAGDAGTGMLWWWDSYVEPLDLYHHFAPIARFVDGLPLNRARYRPAEVAAIEYAGSPPPPRFEDFVVPIERGSWQPAPYNKPATIVIAPDGRVDPPKRLARILHGIRNHPKLHNPVVLRLNYTHAGKFVARVSGVSGHGGAKLKIYVDGQLRLSRDFVDDQQAGGTVDKYNGEYAVDVPPGEHEIRVINDGQDWLYINYRLTGYRRRTDPGLYAWALIADAAPSDGPVALLWVKNERYNWHNHNRGETLREIPATVVALAGLPDGRYEVERWDTNEGAVIDRLPAECQNGRLTVSLPAMKTDVACKVFAK